jgi:SH3-like domain-containing protein
MMMARIFLLATVLASVLLSARAAAVQATMAAPDGAPQDQKSSPDNGPESWPETRLDTPSGQPVPRFVSLKAKQTFCRSGPTFGHPVRITFMRRGLPVMVVAETTDHWRKVRDVDDDECWIHKTKLSNAKTALVTVDGLALYTRPSAAAPQKVRLGRGVIARIEAVENGWLRVSVDGRKGWAPQTGFWGVIAATQPAAPRD